MVFEFRTSEAFLSAIYCLGRRKNVCRFAHFVLYGRPVCAHCGVVL